MRIVAIEPIDALTSEEHELIRLAFDGFPSGLFADDDGSTRDELALYVLSDGHGARRVVAPRDGALGVGDDVSGLISPVSIVKMSNAPRTSGSEDAVEASFPLLELTPKLRRVHGR